MPDNIEVLDEVTAGAFSTGIQANFAADPARAGRLLMAFYTNDPLTSGLRLPDEPGWTKLFNFSTGAPSYVWIKVSDGTETTVTVSHGVPNRQTALSVASMSADPATIEGPSDQARPTAATMVVESAPVNTRFDFTIGDQAPTAAPSTGAPGELISAHSGASQRRGSSWYLISLGPQPTGAVVPGLTYVDMSNVGNGAWSILLQVEPAIEAGLLVGPLQMRPT
jgi:hypothetical protein